MADLNHLQQYIDLTSHAVLEYRLWVLYGTIEITFYTGNSAS
jgi:hypothetical protein